MKKFFKRIYDYLYWQGFDLFVITLLIGLVVFCVICFVLSATGSTAGSAPTHEIHTIWIPSSGGTMTPIFICD